jgi:hypothetical protein
MRAVLHRLSRSAVILALALATPLAAPARAHDGVDDDFIYLCVDRFGADRGEVRLVSRFEKCPFGSSRLVLNPRGPQGPKGDRGPAGPQGPAGIQGPPGEGNPERLAALEQSVQTLQTQVQSLLGLQTQVQSLLDLQPQIQSLLGLQAQIQSLLSLEPQIQNLQTQIDALQGLLGLSQHLHVETGEINGLAGPHVVIEGANVHIRSGSGATRDNGSLTGLGNLIVGYNEPMVGAEPGYRGGSHNLVVGPEHLYSSTGGFVAGVGNGVAAESSSVLGGSDNLASGPSSSVAAGLSNTASGEYASVLGGEFNTAEAFGATVAGGSNNTASGGDASVAGGTNNTASGIFSVVGGGSSRSVTGMFDWRAGSLFETQ